MSLLTVRGKIHIARYLNRALRLLRGLAGRGMRTTCSRRGINWSLDLDEGIDLAIYLQGAYEPRDCRAYTPLIRPGAVVFDIGANIGAHTLPFARLVGAAGRVVAFEPTDYAVAKLRRNLDLNPELRQRVEVQQCFLVAEGPAVLPAAIPSSWPVAEAGPGLHAEHLGKPQTLAAARAITADDYCTAAGVDRLDFVKIDVDGYEYPVLRGFRRCLERFRPTILIELAPFVYTGAQAAEFDDFVRLLTGLGYRFTEAATGRQLDAEPSALRRVIGPGIGMNALLHAR